MKWLRMGFDPLFAPEGDGSGGSGGDGDSNGGDGSGGSGGDDKKPLAPDASSYPTSYNQFSEDLRGNAAFKNEDGTFKQMGAIGREFVQLQTVLKDRDKMVVIPGEGAPQEEIDSFNRKIGRPEGPGEYNLQKPSNWPSDQPWDGRTGPAFAEVAFAAGLTKTQAEQMFNKSIAGLRSERLAETGDRTEKLVKWKAELTETFGEKTDQAIHLANRTLVNLGEPSVAEAVKESGLDTHPGFVRMLNKVWKAIGSDKIFSGSVDTDGKTTQERVEGLYPNTDFTRK